jgi:hypothetical protein
MDGLWQPREALLVENIQVWKAVEGRYFMISAPAELQMVVMLRKGGFISGREASSGESLHRSESLDRRAPSPLCCYENTGLAWNDASWLRQTDFGLVLWPPILDNTTFTCADCYSGVANSHVMR